MTKKQSSIASYLFTRLSAVMVLGVFLVAVILVIYTRYDAKQRFHKEGLVWRDLIAQTAKIGIFTENQDTLYQTFMGFIRQKGVNEVAAYNRAGLSIIRLTRQGDAINEHREQSPMDPAVYSQILTADTLFMPAAEAWEGTYYQVVYTDSYDSDADLVFGEGPTKPAHRIVGFVSITYGGKETRAEQQRILIIIVLGTLFLSFIAIVLAKPLVTRAISPILYISRAIETAAADGLPRDPLKIDSSFQLREISQLIRAFNSLSESLQEKESQRKGIETQLRQAQKLESIGLLSAGLAHDYNNLLTAIIANTHALAPGLAGSTYENNVAQIEAAVQQAAAITKNLLLFSQRDTTDSMRPVDLSSLAVDMLSLIRALLPDNIFVTSHIADSVIILANKNLIQQCILNIALNAKDAMPQGGEITLSVDTTWSPSVGATCANIRITDTGLGMTPEVQAHIFEPFYTTKEVGKGTGLGLSIVYGIVTQHGGTIDVVSESGSGTTVNIYIPVVSVKETPSHLSPETDTSGPLEGNETILFAEDNEFVREIFADTLTKKGYTIIKAVDGYDAVSKYNGSNRAIDIIVSDIIMPGKSGIQVYEELRKQNKTVKFIFMTGYSDEITAASYPADAVIMMKPVTPADLLKQLRLLLDNKSEFLK